MHKLLAIVAAGVFSIGVFTGIVAAVSVNHAAGSTTIVAGCEYTDRTNCDYDGQY